MFNGEDVTTLSLGQYHLVYYFTLYEEQAVVTLKQAILTTHAMGS